MTHLTATPSATSGSATPTTTSASLGSLHLVRAGFSLAWVATVLSTSSSLRSADGLTATAAALLVAYPLWDVAATVLERRTAGRGSLTRIGVVNVALGLAATVAMLVAVLDTVGSSLLVFGVWALLSGAIQLVVATRRRRTVGAQWPMLVSGGLSVLAGAMFAATSGSSSSGLASLAGYSAFGAFWFLVSGAVLTFRARHPARG